MARRNESHKREALARRRAIGRIRLAAVGFVLGGVLGASLAGILLSPPDDPSSADRTPPYILSVEPEDGALLAAGNATFRIAFSEALAAPPTVDLAGTTTIAIEDESFDGLFWKGAATIPEGADGSYNLTVAAIRDLRHNEMPGHATTYLVDTEAPRTRTRALVNRTSAPFDVAWDASDGHGSGVARVDLRYRGSTGPWIILTSGPEAAGGYRVDPGEVEATFMFCALAVDLAGNPEGPCTDGATVDYDATPPSASLLPRPYWALGPVELDGIVANNASTAELRYYFASDNATWQGPFSGGNTTSPFRWTFAFPFGGGHYRLSARGRDGRGWTEPEQTPWSAEVAIGLDIEAPGSWIDPVGVYWRAEPVTLFANGSDDESGVATVDLYYTYRANGTASWSPWTFAMTRVQSPWVFAFDFPQGDGRYELATRARDRAGREEALPPLGQGDVALAYNAHAPEAAVLLLPNFIDPAAKATNTTWTATPAPDVVRFEAHRGTTATFTPDGMACEISETCVASLSRTDRTAWILLPLENLTYFMRIRTVDDGGRRTDGNAYGAVFHGLGFDTPSSLGSAAPLPLEVAWSERLQFAGTCQDCSDTFKVTLSKGDVLALSLAVPSTGDFRLVLLNSAVTTLAESKRTGYGVWESLLYEAIGAGTYYVVVDWSNVVGPGNRNEGWYTLAAAIG